MNPKITRYTAITMTAITLIAALWNPFQLFLAFCWAVIALAAWCTRKEDDDIVEFKE